MTVLAIDTATEVLALALGEPGLEPLEKRLDAGRSHLELLMPAIHEMLGEAGLGVDDLRAVVAGTGPGTFSGLRVGVATARALAQAGEIPVSGFSTLEALANGLAAGADIEGSCLLLPLIDAKRGQVFTQAYRKEGDGGVAAESGILCLDPDKVDVFLTGLPGLPAIAGGNGAIAYRDVLGSSKRLELLASEEQANRVSAVWHLGSAPDRGYRPSDVIELLPEYVRDPDADKTILLRKKEPWLK